jgi:hypothetical protein
VSRLLLLGVALAGCVEERGPRLDAVEPVAAGRGALVTLLGRRLCGEPANCDAAGGKIQLGLSPPSVLARVVEYSDTRAVIQIPQIAPSGPTQIVVTVNEYASNAIDFEILESGSAR